MLTVTLSDLRRGYDELPFDDPAGFARMQPAKRQALLALPGGRETDPVQVLAVRGREPVGRMDLVRQDFLVPGPGGEVREPIFWGSEFVVPEEHRGSLAGVTILLHLSRLGVTLGAAGPSKVALELYQKLKWIDIPMERFILLRRGRSVVERFIGKGLHARAAALLADAGLALHRAAIAPLLRSAVRGMQESIEDRVDDALATSEAVGQAAARADLSPRWLRWGLDHTLSNDSRDGKELVVLREKGGAAAGFALVKRKFYPVATHRRFENLLLGQVMVWKSLRPGLDDWSAVAAGVRRLLRSGVDAVEVCTAEPRTAARLKRLGFIRAGSMHVVVKPAPKSPLADKSFADPARWSLRPGDGDNLLF